MSTLIEIHQQIAELQAKAAELRKSELSEKMNMIKETMMAYGITIEDIAKITSRMKSSNPAPIKFRGPNGEAWSGRGLKPNWITALLNDGHTLEEFAVKTTEPSPAVDIVSVD